MAYQLWSQDIFTKGELSPFLYSRSTVNEYLNGLKTAQNVLTFPSGAAGKRFGTLYEATLQGFTSAFQVYFQSFQYLNEANYQLVFAPGNTYIYLEGGLVATVTNTFNGEQCYNIDSTVIGAIFRVAGQTFGTSGSNKPWDLTRGPDAGNVVLSVTATTITLTNPTLYNGLVIPVMFQVAGGTIIQTVPQINAGVTYFAKFVSATTFRLYASSFNAANDISAYTITNAGTGTTTAFTLNTWTLANTTFKNLPVYDFNGQISSYDAITFTPSAVNGTGVTITLSAPYALLTAAYVGGAFIGGGGTSRITAVTDTSHFVVSVQDPFGSMMPIQGSLALLAEPAWSDARGWPQKCSSYQNRAIFCNTASLPNGFWASAVNDYSDFGDLTGDDDDAISWFPTSNNVNFIRFIVPYRSLTVHTNSGIYSSPLSDVVAITPSNFTLQLQDSTPADVVQPQAVDNQILVLSGDDAHQMIWDGINNAYTSDVVSVINEQTIREPVDETAFADLHRAGSRFVLIINENGSMSIFQTLISQNVGGFVPAIMEQSYGNAFFRQCCSSPEGRCWFLNERQIASASAPIAITGFTGGLTTSTLTAIASNFSLTVPTAITFTTTGALPSAMPPIAVQTYYWAIGITADTFVVYLDQADALAGTNRAVFSNAGVNSNVVPWPLAAQNIFTLEELTKDVFLDCAIKYSGTTTNTITTGPIFNAQDVKMVGDGFGFDAVGVNNQVVFTAHGVPVDVTEAFIGFPINTIMEPMPLSMANGPSAKETTLTKPKHIRSVRFMFNNTIGGIINGVPIAIKTFDMTAIGQPPIPARGIFEMSIMKAWDDFNNPSYTIFHNDPFEIQLLGVFYSVET